MKKIKKTKIEEYYQREENKRFVIYIFVVLFSATIGYCICDFVHKRPILEERNNQSTSLYLSAKGEMPLISTLYSQGVFLLPMAVISPQKTQIRATITAYNNTVEQCDSTPNIMASGNRVYEGAIACPTWLEFGKKVEIDRKVYTCEDRMATSNDGMFDIFMFDKGSAIEWGKQIKNVKIY